jgi:hypothetical protein
LWVGWVVERVAYSFSSNRVAKRERQGLHMMHEMAGWVSYYKACIEHPELRGVENPESVSGYIYNQYKPQTVEDHLRLIREHSPTLAGRFAKADVKSDGVLLWTEN